MAVKIVMYLKINMAARKGKARMENDMKPQDVWKLNEAMLSHPILLPKINNAYDLLGLIAPVMIK